MSGVSPETLAAMREVLRECGINASEETARALLRMVPHLLALERDWSGCAGFVIARYQDGKLVKAEHKVEERIEQEAA